MCSEPSLEIIPVLAMNLIISSLKVFMAILQLLLVPVPAMTLSVQRSSGPLSLSADFKAGLNASVK